MTKPLDLFISSKMQELREEREALYELIPTLSQGVINLRAWVFESDAPAADKTIRDIYLKALKDSALYIGLFWNDYGEYTIDEFDRATEWGIPRHIYVKDVEAEKRDPRLTDFLNKHSTVTSGITAKWFKTTDELKTAIKNSIGAWLEDRLMYQTRSVSAILAPPQSIIEAPPKLIGRESLETEMQTALEAGKRVLLHGFAGMGKTALADTIASDWIMAEKGAVLRVEVGVAEAEEIFLEIARCLGVQQLIINEHNKIQRVRTILGESTAKLMIIDDAWNGRALAQVIKAVPPSISLVITSRYEYFLDPPQALIKVRELAPDKAVEMLGEYAGKDYQGDSDAAAICKLLGYLAFAIRIAGKNLAGGIKPAKLIDLIEDAPHTMKIPLSFEETGRENVAALLEVSLVALDKFTCNVFLAFGAFFTSSVTPEMLSLYLKQELKTVEKALFDLQQHGLAELVEATQESVAYFRIHDLAYSYAKAQSNEEEQHKVLDACLTYTQSYNEPNLANFSALRPELENFMGAANFAMGMERYKEVEDLARILYAGVKANGGFLFLRGFYAQAANLLLQAAQAAKKQGKRNNQGIHIGNLGLAYAKQGLAERAIEYYEQALAIAREIDDKRSEGNQLVNLGDAYAKLAQIEQAIKCYEQALINARKTGDKQSEGYCLSGLGIVYANLGQLERAIDSFQQALTNAREIGDKRGEITALGNLGNACYLLGQIEQAITYYMQALALSRIAGDKSNIVNWLSGLGLAYADRRETEQAIDAFGQALAIAREIGDRRGEGIALGNLGNVYRTHGEIEEAIKFHEQSLAIAREIGDKQGVGSTLCNLGNAYFSLEQVERAIEFYQQALSINRETGSKLDEAHSLNNLGMVHEKNKQDYSAALNYYQQARAICDQIGLMQKLELIDNSIARVQAKLASGES